MNQAIDHRKLAHSATVVPFKRLRQERMPDDKPILDDGYCRVVNVLAEGLAKSSLTSLEHRVVWSVIRLTYGWQKGKDRIAASQIAKATGLTRQKCSSTLSGLIERGVIIREGGSHSAIKINTKTEQWTTREKATKAPQKSKVNPISKNGSLNPITVTNTNPITVHTKDKRNKDNNTTCYPSENPELNLPAETQKPGAAIQNKSGTKFGYSVDLDIASFIANTVNAKLGSDAPPKQDLATWANTVRLMREKDSREPAAIRALFAWASQDPFWSASILSPEKLRKQWSALASKRNSQRNGGGNETNRTSGSNSDERLTRQLTDIDYARENF